MIGLHTSLSSIVRALARGLWLFVWTGLAAWAHAQVTNGAVDAPAERAVRLDGLWTFTPLPLAASPRSANAPLPDGDATTLRVPGNWDKLQGASGSGTYELALQQLQPGKTYALQFKGIASTATIHIDSQQIGHWGAQGISFIPQVYFFQATAPQAMLRVVVRNPYLSFGGLWMPVYFGPAEAVSHAALQTQFFDALLLGGVLIIALYHLGLFGFRPSDRAPLYFAVFSTLSVVKASLSGEQLLFHVLPWLDEGVGLRIAYLSTIAMPIAFMAYLQALFPVRHYQKALYALIGVALPSTVLSVVAPYHVLQSWFWPYQLAIVGVLAHGAFTLALAIRQRRPGSMLMFAGFVVISAATINDILYDNRVIATFYAFNIGVVVFLLLQALIMGGVFARAFNRVQELNETLELKVQERTQELEELSRRDPLTGLMNRRWFMETLHREWERWERYQDDFCVALVDVDHFKHINDSQGHSAGDAALQDLARLLASHLRKTDWVSRHGGEEFCVLLPHTDLLHANGVLEKMRQQCANNQGFTFSYGLALASRYQRAEDLLNGADRLMYQAKQDGRNRGCSDSTVPANPIG